MKKMKRLKLALLLPILLNMIVAKSFAHDIEVTNADGVTIYYKFINNSTELAVTFRGDSESLYSNEYSGNVVIPSEVIYMSKTYKVTNILNSAFEGCFGLTSITIPNSVTTIRFDAFRYCSGLTSITIPNSVTSIESSAFYNCSALTSITIPNGVTTIGDYTFYNCSKLASITIPNSVMSIGNDAFKYTTWYNNQPDGLVYAGKVAYKYKGTIPSNTSISIKKGTLGIGGSAFAYCYGLTSITIPNSVTKIESSAFYSSGLTSVTIPGSVTSIGYDVFRYCSSLVSIKSEIKAPFAFGSNAFYGISSECVLTIPQGKKDAYIAVGWTEDVFKGGIVEEFPIAVASISETTVRCGYQASIPVQFESELEFGGLQCEVTLPAGVTLNKVTKTARLSEAFTLTKSLTGENTYQILLYNIERATFTGNDGALFNLVVDVADNMAVGNYEIQVKDIVVSDVDNNESELLDTSAILHVEDYLVGDANRDGKVNVTDIMAVANYILKYDVPGFNAAAADVNGDGKINVTDIMGIANIILQPNNANNAPMLQMEPQVDDGMDPE